MSKSKMHKQELGKSRPTENRATNAIINQQVNEWVEKIRGAEKRSVVDYRTGINEVADILAELIDKTLKGEVEQEVIMGVVRRGNWLASLQVAIEKKGVKWIKKGLPKV